MRRANRGRGRHASAHIKHSSSLSSDDDDDDDDDDEVGMNGIRDVGLMRLCQMASARHSTNTLRHAR